jgi:hypothetical protein
MRSGDEDPRAPLQTAERNGKSNATPKKQQLIADQPIFIQEKCHNPNKTGRKQLLKQ